MFRMINEGDPTIGRSTFDENRPRAALGVGSFKGRGRFTSRRNCFTSGYAASGGKLTAKRLTRLHSKGCCPPALLSGLRTDVSLRPIQVAIAVVNSRGPRGVR